jgi:hypothetical protein
MSGQPESLRQLGRDGNKPYALHSSINAIPVVFEFEGLFNHQPIRWKATLWPRGHHPDPCPDQDSQFMRIGEELDGVRAITIGLNIGQIDHATLLMTIIMVRKYKRLREGLICFGKNQTDQEI